MSIIEVLTLAIAITFFFLGTTAMLACLFKDARSHAVGAIHIDGMSQEEVDELLEEMGV